MTSSENHTRADLVVVGGGVLGCATAYQACRDHPDWRVVLLEQNRIGSGATGWSAGLSVPLAATAEHRPLVRESARLFDQLRKQQVLHGDLSWPVRVVYVVSSQRLADFRATVVDARLRDLTSAERVLVDRMLPDLVLAPTDVLLTHDGHAFVLAARTLADMLVLAGIDSGRLEVHENQRVCRISRDGGFDVHTGEHVWSTRRVVVTTGPWQHPAYDGGASPVSPEVRTKRVAALRVRLPVLPADPCVYFVDDDLFMLPMSRGSALVSYRRDQWEVDPDRCDGRPTASDQQEGTTALARRSASAARAVIGGQAFCDAYAPQRLPTVVTGQDSPGFATVTGGSGSGVRLAPALATRLLRAVE